MPSFKPKTNKKVIVDEIKAATLDTKHNEMIEFYVNKNNEFNKLIESYKKNNGEFPTVDRTLNLILRKICD